DDISGDNSAAANLIRQKLDSLYTHEPDDVTEAIESVQAPTKARSKHQKFMADLASSGKPFAQIQTEWHEYYQSLPDNEKHEVWQAFYAAHNPHSKPVAHQITTQSKFVTGSFADEPLKITRTRSIKQKVKHIKDPQTV